MSLCQCRNLYQLSHNETCHEEWCGEWAERKKTDIDAVID